MNICSKRAQNIAVLYRVNLSISGQLLLYMKKLNKTKITDVHISMSTLCAYIA
jgi:hypothetical protein